jgi:hypothetical protein
LHPDFRNKVSRTNYIKTSYKKEEKNEFCILLKMIFFSGKIELLTFLF